MKLFLNLLTLAFSCIQIVDSRKVRGVPDDEIYPYLIDKRVTHASVYFSSEHLIFELIDDDNVMLGGYVEFLRSFDPKLLVTLSLQTQYLYQSTWVEGPLRLIVPDSCPYAQDSASMFYNISKLWTSCPPQKGDILPIEEQIIDFQFSVPPSMPLGMWRFHFIFSQELFGAVHKFGGTIQLELIEVV